jgi:hypothetical protein
LHCFSGVDVEWLPQSRDLIVIDDRIGELLAEIVA